MGGISGLADFDRRSWSRTLSWLPIPLLLAAIIAARAAGLHGAYESHALTLVLSFIFYTMVSLGTLFLVGRSFLASGTPGLLLLECGVVLWSLAGTVGDAVSHGDANVNVTIFNTGILLAGMCHLAGVVLALRPPRALRARRLWLAAGCALAVGALLLVTRAALAGWLPVFFIPGQGGTVVRYCVLAAAIAMFALSASLLYVGRRVARPGFASWYGRALLLLAVGLFGVMIQLSLGSAVNWLGRTAQWLGGFYLLLAAIAALRESNLRLLPSEERSRPAYYRDAMAVVVVFAAAAVRLVFLSAMGAHSPYVLFFPAVIFAAIYGGRRAGLLATGLAALLAGYFWVPGLNFSTLPDPADWLGLVIFLMSGALVSYVAEAMHRAIARASAAEAQSLLAAERERAAQAVRESEHRYRSLFNGMTEGFAIHEIITDEQGTPTDYRFLDINPAFERLTGLTREAVLGKTHNEVLPGDDPKWLRMYGAVALMGEPVQFENYSPALKRHYEVLAYRPAPRQFAVIFMDVTERKKAEEALRESEARFRSVLDNSRDVIYRLNVQTGRYEYISPSAERVIGLRADEMMAMDVEAGLSMIHPDDLPAVRAAHARLAETGEGDLEYRQRAKSGDYRWLSNHLSLTRDGAGRPLYRSGNLSDITQRKQAEEALRELNLSLEQRVAERTAEVQRLADQLRALASDLSQTEQRERKRLASILHDHIQQLLVAARMQLEWVRSDNRPERLQSTLQGVVAILREATDAVRSLTVELSPPVLHDAGLIGGLNWLASRMQEKNQFTVSLRADNKAEPAAEDMRLLLFEAVRELLFNAFKHSGVSEADVTLMRTRDDMVRVIVRDNGKGFDPDLLKKRQSGDDTFGLFSLQQRLAHVGGQMEVMAAPGAGTKITLTVPASKATPREVAAAESAGAEAESKERKKQAVCRVLIVDDHKIMREGLVGLLRFESDIEVVGEAADGPQAIELAGKLKPNVVIMDVTLGEMSGVEATRRVLAANPKVKVIGLSMHADKEIASAMRDAGAVAYLTKGGPPEDLIAALRACHTL